MIHTTSCIDDGATIGNHTKVWHYCHIMGSAVIGDFSSIGQGCFVGENVSIGSWVRIQNNVSIFEGVTIEDEVFLGPSCVFTNVLRPRGTTQVRKYEKTIIRKGASIGANATILCGIEIGEYALIGAGAIVTKSVPAGGCIRGLPGLLAGFVDKKGKPKG